MQLNVRHGLVTNVMFRAVNRSAMDSVRPKLCLCAGFITDTSSHWLLNSQSRVALRVSNNGGGYGDTKLH